jgi:signal transduction histidine kinase
MSCAGLKAALRSFSLRLNLWYAAFFIVTGLGLFSLAYVLLATSLEQKEREAIRAKLDEYRAWYQAGGLEGLQQRFLTVRAGDRNAFFVRVIGTLNNALFLSVPDTWEGFDPEHAALVRAEGRQPWVSLTSRDLRQAWMLTAARLYDGRVLQVGKSTEGSQEMLQHFRRVFIFATLGIVVLGFAGGAFLTYRALHPIRQLIVAVRGIIETGRMEARLPTRRTGDELDELVALFNRMLEKNQTLIRGMREALDNVAHDLRTPMTRLRGSAEMTLQSGADAAACREALADTLEESERVLTMLNTLMDISEAEAGTMHLRLEPLDAARLVADVVELYSIVAEEKGVALQAPPEPSLEFSGDRVRLEQALANLIDNAIKYTPAGGRIDVHSRRARDAIEFEVRDTGIGIPAAELPRIWERLYRGDQSRSQKGLGLGLCLVRAVAQAHGGDVRAVSQPAAGSAFTLRLPLQRP